MKPRPLLLFLALAGAMGCGGDTDEREPTWGYISAVIMQPNCASSSCHSKAAAVAGLNLSTAEDGHKSLLELHLPARAEDNVPPRPMVVPNNPAESRVVTMLRAIGARRMPPDRPLAEADIRLIERWILNGAQDD